MTDRRWICVEAVGEAGVAPDTALVSMAVTAKGKDLGSTRDDVNRRTSAVLAALRELGLADADLQAPDVGIHPEYDYRKDNQKLVGYRVSRGITARVRTLDTLGDVLDRVVKGGADELHGTQMTASDPAAAEHEALRQAFASARAKADVLATAAGVSLGGVARIEEEPDHGASPMPKMRMMAAAESADVPTEVVAGDLTVTRRVRAWFDLS